MILSLKFLNTVMLADMKREKAGAAFLGLSQRIICLLVDGATIHRADVSLIAVQETFNSRANC